MINEYVNTHKTFYNKIMSIIEVDPSTQNKEFRIIDSIWFARWVRGELDLDCIDMNHFICPHKKLKPSAIAQSKFISVEAWNLLVDKYGGGPPIRDSNLCPDCAVSLYSGHPFFILFLYSSYLLSFIFLIFFFYIFFFFLLFLFFVFYLFLYLIIFFIKL